MKLAYGKANAVPAAYDEAKTHFVSQENAISDVLCRTRLSFYHPHKMTTNPALVTCKVCIGKIKLER